MFCYTGRERARRKEPAAVNRGRNYLNRRSQPGEPFDGGYSNPESEGGVGNQSDWKTKRATGKVFDLSLIRGKGERAGWKKEMNAT